MTEVFIEGTAPTTSCPDARRRSADRDAAAGRPVHSADADGNLVRLKRTRQTGLHACHPHPGGEDPQSPERFGRHPDRPADGRHRRLGLGQVEPRLRHALRRRAAAIRGVALDVCPAVPRAARPSGRGLDRAGASGHRPRAEERGAQRALDRRHPDRDPRLAAPALRPRGHDVLSRLRRRGRAGRRRSRRRGALRGRRRGARATLVAPVPWREPAPAAGARTEAQARGQRLRAPRGVPPRGLLPGASLRRARPSRSGKTSRRSSMRRGACRIVVGRFVVSEAARPEIASAAETAFALAGTLEARIGGAHVRDFPPRAPLSALRARVPRSHAADVRVQLAARRVPGLPGLRARHRRGSGEGDPGPAADARRAAGRALEHSGLRVGLRRTSSAPAGATPSARTFRWRGCRPTSARSSSQGRGDFYGVKGFFDWLETKRYKIHVRVLLARYRAYTPCVACGGARVAPPALWVRFRGRTIAELAELPLRDLQRFFAEVAPSPAEEKRLGLGARGAHLPRPLHERRRPRLPDPRRAPRARSPAARRSASASPPRSAAR